MLRAGLTGGIACGKSLVSGFLREMGAAVVDDDVAARDAVQPGSEALAAVVAEFGPDVLLPDGSLDRPRLGRIVFADDAKRRKLMSITFPAIGRLLLERFAAAESSGAPVLVYESALLIENGQADAWRPLVVVTTTPELQLRRLCERNGLTEAEARDRVRSQMPLEEKARLADHVIENVGRPEETRARCAEVWAALLERARA
ncbi:MAG: dephospho-CoA kinase [Alphaproteobacteria bacterium]